MATSFSLFWAWYLFVRVPIFNLMLEKIAVSCIAPQISITVQVSRLVVTETNGFQFSVLRAQQTIQWPVMPCGQRIMPFWKRALPLWLKSCTKGCPLVIAHISVPVMWRRHKSSHLAFISRHFLFTFSVIACFFDRRCRVAPSHCGCPDCYE